MARSILAVVAGFVLWSVLWIGGGLGVQAAFSADIAEDGSTSAVGPLAALIVLAMVCSLASGAATATIARRRMRPVVALAIVLLLVGVAFEVGAWTLTPVWYHAAFLVLLVPMTIAGGRLAGAKMAAN